MFSIISSWVISLFQEKTLLILYIIIGTLATALITFFFLYKVTTTKLEEKTVEATLWKESAITAESTIDSLLANQKKLDEALQKRELSKLVIEAQTKEVKIQFETLRENNESVKSWSQEQIPQDVQNILMN